MIPQKSMSKAFMLMRSKFGNLVCIDEPDLRKLDVIAKVENVFPRMPMMLESAVMTPLTTDNQCGMG